MSLSGAAGGSGGAQELCYFCNREPATEKVKFWALGWNSRGQAIEGAVVSPSLAA